MATRIGINGFGRIGRQSLRAMLERHPQDLEIVAVNDITNSATNAHLFRYDSTYGRFNGAVEVAGNDLVINGRRITVFSQPDPGHIPWEEAGAQIVIESTGHFTDAAKARAHLHGEVKKVIISAPLHSVATGQDTTIVLGVNEQTYDPARHHVISNASCTTNCLAPTAKVIHDTFGIEQGVMTTVHAYTNDQRLLDVVHKDLRRARAAAQNIIPTTTGAARALALVIPELKGKFDGIALRVPTATVSIVDFVATVRQPASRDAVNDAFKQAAASSLRGILAYTEEPLVSSDFRGDDHSAIVDGLSTQTLGDHLVKVLAWYDNEWGYSCRIADLTDFIARQL
ncbi:MAG TPA: type I glyceraldehyde-3-phosphate dehydrogenase [Ktedonobacterales bacterium]